MMQMKRPCNLPKVPEGWINRANLTVSLGERERAVLPQWRDLEGVQKRYQPILVGSNLWRKEMQLFYDCLLPRKIRAIFRFFSFITIDAWRGGME